MGAFGDGILLQQAKKAQDDNNARLDALITEQRRTNELLAHLITLLTPAAAPPTASWGNQQP